MLSRIADRPSFRIRTRMKARSVLSVAGVIALLVAVGLVATGGCVIYDVRNYGMCLRSRSLGDGVSVDCYISSTNTTRRWGPVLMDRIGEPYVVVLHINRTDSTVTRSLEIARADFTFAGDTQQVVVAPRVVALPGDKPGVGSSNDLPWAATVQIVELGELSLTHSRDEFVDCRLVVRVVTPDGEAVETELQGRAIRENSTTRLWPYWWYLYRKSRAG
jgi:hypothetical protein